MPNAKSIIWALAPFGETADAPMRSDRVKPVPSTRYQFVRIRLMADVPDNQVLWGIKYVVEGQSQFHRSQVRRQMTAVTGNSTDNFISDLCSQPVQLFDGQSLEILRAVDARQNRLFLLFGLGFFFTGFFTQPGTPFWLRRAHGIGVNSER